MLCDGLSFNMILNILQGVQSVTTVTYIPKCKHVFLVNSKFCDLYLWKKCRHGQMVAKRRSVHRTLNSENKVYHTQAYMYECWSLSFWPFVALSILHTRSKFVTLWVSSLNNRQFSIASRENQSYSTLTGVTGYGP